jgi:hypothetical protein
MYYISERGHVYPARICKRLKDFVRTAKPDEGSKWNVRKKKQVGFMDFLDVYEVKNGKLVKNKTEADGGWF